MAWPGVIVLILFLNFTQIDNSFNLMNSYITRLAESSWFGQVVTAYSSCSCFAVL